MAFAINIKLVHHSRTSCTHCHKCCQNRPSWAIFWSRDFVVKCEIKLYYYRTLFQYQRLIHPCFRYVLKHGNQIRFFDFRLNPPRESFFLEKDTTFPFIYTLAHFHLLIHLKHLLLILDFNLTQ